MKASNLAKTILASLAVYSALQFSPVAYTHAEDKQEIVFAEESQKIDKSYNFLEKEVLGFIDKMVKMEDGERGEGWWDKTTDKLYSGAIVNEELGLGFVLYKYTLDDKKYEDWVYLVIVNKDHLQTCKLEDKFKMLSDPVVTYSKEYLDSQLKEYFDHAEEIYNDYCGNLTDPSQKVKYLDGECSGTNISDFHLLKEGGNLYFGIPYYNKEKGTGSLILTLNFRNSEGKLSITLSGEGGAVFENTF